MARASHTPLVPAGLSRSSAATAFAAATSGSILRVSARAERRATLVGDGVVEELADDSATNFLTP